MMPYDVIIVGAGSAGCLLAARLSEDPARSVLLLEAGPEFPAGSMPPDVLDARVPIFGHDWGYYSEPGALGRSMHLPRGKLVGGCSSTNAALALRGLASANPNLPTIMLAERCVAWLARG